MMWMVTVDREGDEDDIYFFESMELVLLSIATTFSKVPHEVTRAPGKIIVSEPDKGIVLVAQQVAKADIRTAPEHF